MLESGEIRETAWKEKRPKKDAVYYANLRTKYEEFIKGNEFLTIPEVLNAVNTQTISLLTTNMNSRKLIGVSRETTEEVLKTVNVA